MSKFNYRFLFAKKAGIFSKLFLSLHSFFIPTDEIFKKIG